MHLRYRLAMPLVALSLALAFAPAMAAKPSHVPAPVNSSLPAPSVVTGSSQCTMGQTGASQAFQWFFPSDDYYYTFIDPSTCCPNGIDNLVAHWLLYWTAPCNINVQVWMVKAVPNGPGCFVPDAGNDPPDPTAAETLCGPTAVFPITGVGLVDHVIPLPPCACINEPAFVLWKIVNNIDCTVSGGSLDNPNIVVDGSPDPCVSYNGFLGGPPNEMPSSFGFPGNTSMYVDADCCIVTKSLPSSWGKLKTLYR